MSRFLNEKKFGKYDIKFEKLTGSWKYGFWFFVAKTYIPVCYKKYESINDVPENLKSLIF